jgi:hypothetical protein
MNYFSRILIPMAGAVMLASCSTAAIEETRSPEAQRELSKALAGRTPGKPVNCIGNFRTSNMQVIDDWTILFREGRVVYVQNPQGGCQGISSGSNTLVSRLHGTNQLCSGDINHLVDLHTGIGGGACVFTAFVPYTKPGG